MAAASAPPKPPAPSAGATPIRIVGGQPHPLRDFYHAFLRMRWWLAFATIVGAYLALNAMFAACYLVLGGVEEMRDGSFADAFFFSVQTMGTIGYGAMHPKSFGANVLVVLESVTGLIVTAVATGLVFAKFSQSQARIVFTREVTIAPMDGVPTLMFRVGNERSNKIIEAQIRVVLIRTERTKEGMLLYRMYDVPLVRERSPAMQRSFMVMHSIVPGSPLHGQTPETLKQGEVELTVSLFGVDDLSLQPVHAQHRYGDDEILWGARHVDILEEQPDGSITLDLRKFHDVVATKATPDFPYPP